MEVGLIRPIDIDHEMRESYLSYAMSVIVSRALPDARDGLKPVQRRILYAMYDMGLRPTLPYRKSARVVGEVLGKYHPHGDQSVYDAMVRMAQSFSLRYMLVEGQGNFGSIDGDAAAAMRYTEARMSNLGHALLDDIEKNTVSFGPNFDDSLKEPTVLPATIPNLLVNGASGIAVGMATSIPPHNLGEIIDALAYMLDGWATLDDITVADLLQFVKGPDFPTGGFIFRHRDTKTGETDAIANAYATGKGAITVRAKVHVEQIERSKSRIVITELPYQTNITNMLERIADLHRDDRIEGLTDLRDESDRNGMRIILETARGAKIEDILAQLFQLTPLQSTFSINLLALVNGEPRVLNLKQALRVYLDHRQEIVRRRSEHDLQKAQDRAHILAGLIIALDHMDEIIDTIRRSQTTETAQANLQKKFKLSELQAKAVLDMPLRRLVGLERRKLKDEYDEKQRLIKYLQRILATPEEMRMVIKEELLAIKKQYADVRRTQIVDKEASQVVTQADLLPDEQVWVMVGDKGTIGRTTSPEPVKVPLKPDELPLALLQASTQDVLYLFTADGQGVSLPVYQLPKATELGQGTHYAELSGLDKRDFVAAAITLPTIADGYLFLTTLAGVVKRIRLDDLPGITTTPYTIMRVDDGDALGWAKLTTGDNEIMLGTAAGQLIRFKEEDVRPMGLPAGGVAGIKLQDEADGVIGVELARPETFVWSISDNGFAKATAIEEYPVQGRNGQGVQNFKLGKGASEVVAIAVVSEKQEIIFKTATESARRIKIKETVVGRRSITPREVITVRGTNRVTGVVQVNQRWENMPVVAVEEDEAASLATAQLALL
ncbi:MAG: DNA gyrase subunit A [Chloroflexi bacterium]|nr:DNA gyrase subunit A [Chloroflexota bacterium]